MAQDGVQGLRLLQPEQLLQGLLALLQGLGKAALAYTVADSVPDSGGDEALHRPGPGDGGDLLWQAKTGAELLDSPEALLRGASPGHYLHQGPLPIAGAGVEEEPLVHYP